MKFPEFTYVRASTFYMYRDPYTFKNDPDRMNPHIMDSYAFYFYHADFEGGIEVDGVFNHATANCFSFIKPLQRKRIIMPMRGHYLKIMTEDHALKAALDRLPPFGYHPETPQLIDLCKKIFTVNSSTVEGQLEMQGLIISILRIMLNYNPSPANATEAIPRRHQAALEAANRYLQEHLDEAVDLTKLAKESGLYPTYFHKLFTEAYGRTPTQQQTWHRLQKSMSLLQDDNCPIVEIAEQCGFSSHSYFCYVFKKMLGASPSEYRQRHRTSRKNQ